MPRSRDVILQEGVDRSGQLREMRFERWPCGVKRELSEVERVGHAGIVQAPAAAQSENCVTMCTSKLILLANPGRGFAGREIRLSG